MTAGCQAVTEAATCGTVSAGSRRAFESGPPAMSCERKTPNDDLPEPYGPTTRTDLCADLGPSPTARRVATSLAAGVRTYHPRAPGESWRWAERSGGKGGVGACKSRWYQ